MGYLKILIFLLHVDCLIFAAITNRYFLATTIVGGEGILAGEISRLADAHSVIEAKGQVYFQGTTLTGLEGLMKLRTSLKLLERVSDANNIETKDDLYAFVSSFDWNTIISPGDSLKVDVTMGRIDSELSHSHFTALTVKNAIVDQFRDRFNKRPDVNLESPDLPILLYLHADRAILYRVWSGESSMHKRGYRESIHRAALRETTAAILVLLSNWNSSQGVLCDPMCGSGTIVIEAALLSADCSPGLIRYNKLDPTPLNWRDISATVIWDEVCEEATSRDRRDYLTRQKIPICQANDIHPGAIELAKTSAKIARVHKLIDFSNVDIASYRPSVKPEVTITNPPWDLRLQEGAETSWDSLGNFGKRELQDKTLWALSGNPTISQFIRLKSSLKVPLNAASVDMRFLKYEIR
jgi:putative N6-adenine-specific DNA methylase